MTVQGQIRDTARKAGLRRDTAQPVQPRAKHCLVSGLFARVGGQLRGPPGPPCANKRARAGNGTAPVELKAARSQPDSWLGTTGHLKAHALVRKKAGWTLKAPTRDGRKQRPKHSQRYRCANGRKGRIGGASDQSCRLPDSARAEFSQRCAVAVPTGAPTSTSKS